MVKCVNGGCYFTDINSLPYQYIKVGKLEYFNKLNSAVEKTFREHSKPNRMFYEKTIKKRLADSNLLTDYKVIGGTKYAVFNTGLGAECDVVFLNLSNIASIDIKINQFKGQLKKAFRIEMDNRSSFKLGDDFLIVKDKKSESYHLVSPLFKQSGEKVESLFAKYYNKRYPTYPWSFYSKPIFGNKEGEKHLYRLSDGGFFYISVKKEGVSWERYLTNNNRKLSENIWRKENKGFERFQLPVQKDEKTVLETKPSKIVGTVLCPMRNNGRHIPNCIQCDGSGYQNVTSGGSQKYREVWYSDWELNSTLTDGEDVYFKFTSELTVKVVLSSDGQSSVLKKDVTVNEYYFIYDRNFKFKRTAKSISPETKLINLDFSTL